MKIKSQFFNILPDVKRQIEIATPQSFKYLRNGYDTEYVQDFAEKVAFKKLLDESFRKLEENAE